MHRPVIIPIRPHLKTHAIPRHGDDVVIPHEPRDGLALDQSAVAMFVSLCFGPVFFLLVEGERFPRLREAAAEEEDVAVLELNPAFSGNFLDFLERDGVAGHPVGFHPLFLGIRNIVYQHPSSSDSFLSPVADSYAGTLHAGDFVGGGPAVPGAGAVGHNGAVVPEAVPLGGGLGVEAPDVVPGDAFIVGDRDYGVFCGEAVETCVGGREVLVDRFNDLSANDRTVKVGLRCEESCQHKSGRGRLISRYMCGRIGQRKSNVSGRNAVDGFSWVS
jgi:hypothetical protein